MAVNDVSERDWQLERGGQWLKGKSYPTFNPAGPVLVTPDEVGDVTDLRLTLSVNGERMQQGSTADMVFDPHYLVWYLSQFVMLEAGDPLPACRRRDHAVDHWSGQPAQPSPHDEMTRSRRVDTAKLDYVMTHRNYDKPLNRNI